MVGEMPRATVLRDSVWGDVDLGARDLTLIDTPPFQRLRRVRQLGFTDLVFPGAHHSRFEHSLGVAHVAGTALARLRSVAGAPSLADADVRAFRSAALLHDVGHYPFSHAVEELEVAQVRDHEGLAAERIRSEPIAGILEREWGVDPARVAWLVAGREQPVDPTEGLHLLRSLLDGGLDVDKLDYLVRDARAANVPYGLVDVQRLLSCLAVSREPGGPPRLAIDVKGVAALQSLVFAKYLMFATVYWHHACRAAVVMLLRALQEALAAGALDASDLEYADDASLIALLRSPGMPPLTRRLGGRLLDRRLYKRALDVGIDDGAFPVLQELWSQPADRAAAEDRWAAELGLEPGSILLDIPEPKLLGTDLPPVVEDGTVVRWDEASGLAGHDLARLERWARRIRVFAAGMAEAGLAGDRRAQLLDLPRL
jgi:HD superfamily phosphohydrolase